MALDDDFDQPDSIFDDDSYWINQREADDYRHENDDLLEAEDIIDDESFVWDEDDDDLFGYEPDPDFDYDDRVNW